jgi:hypothetical protein
VKQAEEEEGGGGCSAVWCSLHSRQRPWNEDGAVAKPWAAKRRLRLWSGRHRRGLGIKIRTVRLTSGPHAVSLFSELSKLVETCKVENSALSCSKFSQFLYDAILGGF